MNPDLLIMIASSLGTIAFSISGALIAIECNLDIFGVIMSGCFTACGGGVLRDVMLQTHINMFTDPMYVIISFFISIAVFLVVYFIKNIDFSNNKFYKNFLVITDSIGLGAFVVVGMNAAINAQETSMFAICFYGVLTAVGGGLIRDICVNKIPAIFRKHIYAVAAIIGSIIFYLLMKVNFNYLANVILTVFVIVLVRYLAFYFELGLPKIKIDENK